MMVSSAARPRRIRAERAGDVSAELTLLRDVLGPRADTASRSELVEVDASMTWPRLTRFIEECRLPILTKGIISANDVIQACEAGSAGGSSEVCPTTALLMAIVRREQWSVEGSPNETRLPTSSSIQAWRWKRSR